MGDFKGTNQTWELFEVQVSEEVVTPYFYIQGKYDGEGVCVLELNGSVTLDKLKANAKLILCANEMLEMLKECAQFMDKVQAPVTSAIFLKSNIRELIKKATE